MQSLAPAKVNLFLHVGAPGSDGFHPLSSLMAFADIGDSLSLDPGERGFQIEGPFAAGLSSGPDNLVLRARDALTAYAQAPADFRLVLRKTIPVAAGLGGGSSDAAATLRLVRAHLGLAVDDDALRAIAGALGSDTPACVTPKPVIASGRGDILAPAPRFPDLPAVLVNPGVACPTAAVYRAYDVAVASQGAEGPPWPRDFSSIGAVVAFLETCRNDLEAPAVALHPKIGEALRTIAADPGALLTRMSGSGATCMALAVGSQAASHMAARLSAAHPSWWVRACTIAGS